MVPDCVLVPVMDWGQVGDLHWGLIHIGLVGLESVGLRVVDVLSASVARCRRMGLVIFWWGRRWGMVFWLFIGVMMRVAIVPRLVPYRRPVTRIGFVFVHVVVFNGDVLVISPVAVSRSATSWLRSDRVNDILDAPRIRRV